MPPTSDPPGPKSTWFGFAGLPDRDNPFAWKRAVEQGRQGARELLCELTDEEVGRYMALATDQIGIEERHGGVKIASAIAGAALLALAVVTGVRAGFGGAPTVGLGIGLAMVYWPWRVMKCRQLWRTHFEAAKAEQVRRRPPA